jgi:FAD/FMN-containing dehydrogenase
MTINLATASPSTLGASGSEMKTTTEVTTAITGPALERLATEVTGPVIVPGDERYAAETATWNLSLAHQPAVAVGATCAADVQAAVRFAGAHNLPVAVVATGHGAVVPADGALLINLRRMDSIVIDGEQRTATVGAAVQMQHLIDKAAEKRLAPLAGSSPNVGVVGYTLGGGLSPTLGRAYGYAADYVRAAEIVTPDGELRRIDRETEPDLFWAIRGGKGNFGVVTSLTLDLVPVTRLYGGGLFYAGEHADKVLDAYRKLVADAPEILTASIAFLRLPPLPFVPEPLQGRLTVHVRIAYLMWATEAEDLIAGLRAAAPTLIDSVSEMPFTAVASIHADPVDPVPAYEISAQLADFPREAADALIAVAGPEADTPALMVEIRQLGGALAREPKEPSAVGTRHARFQLFAGAVGAPGMEQTFRPALQSLVDALAPWGTGTTQINFLTGYDTAPEAVRKAYEPETYERLVQIKEKYDPQNLFRVNHNIPPAW